MMQVLIVFLGGGLGAVLRYMLSLKLTTSEHFPYHTLVINVLGCFIIGLIMAYAHKLDHKLLLFLATGFCGGFTTLSTFSFEILQLLKQNHWQLACLYMVSTMILSVLAVFTSYLLVNR